MTLKKKHLTKILENEEVQQMTKCYITMNYTLKIQHKSRKNVRKLFFSSSMLILHLENKIEKKYLLYICAVCKDNSCSVSTNLK